MALLNVGGVSLAYDDVGPADSARAVILLHGFTSNRNENWRRLGWLGAFERRRTRAVAYDLRGHGESDKPVDPSAYGTAELLSDLAGVIAALDLREVTLMGYSMGARLALAAAIAEPDRFHRVILGGIGDRIFEPSPAGHPMAAAMEAADPGSISDPLLRSFRQFADEQGENRAALAAFSRAVRSSFDRESLRNIRAQTLVVAGARDALAGSAEGLAALILGAKAVELPGCDHFSAIAHALFKAAVFDFLEETDF